MSVIARIAHWSTGHWKTVVFGWIALVVALAVIASHVGTTAQSELDAMNGDSRTGYSMLLDAGLEADAGEVVFISSGTKPADGAAAAALAERVADRISGMSGVSNVQWEAEQLVSADNEARIVTFDLDGTDASPIDERVVPIRKAVDAIDASGDGFRVQQFGDASLDADIGEIVGADLGKAEALTAPITLVILFLTFGALVAAGLPLLIGGVSVFAAISLGSILSHVLPQSDFAPSLVSMLGIALGVDYTLFLLRREREERAKGYSGREAIVRAAATSGTAVVISGITVIVALSGLLVSGAGMFVSMGIASMLVVGTVLLAALFVVPALLHKLGDRVERGRFPRLGRRRRQPRPTTARARESRVWSAVVGIAVRRPVATIVVVAALLLAACVPVLSMETGDGTLAGLPQEKPALQAAAAYQGHFPGGAEPAKVVIRDDSGSGDARISDAVDRLTAAATDRGVVTGPPTSRVSEDGRTHLITYPLAGSESRKSSDRAVERMRGLVTDNVAPVAGTTVAVTGGAAESYDFSHVLSSHMPIVFLVVLGAAFVLLTCAFRSVVVPVVAVALNLLSVGAAYGFLVWGFQWGHLGGLLPIPDGTPVVSWMPMFLFALLFGLSMDYHVFMISRIREQVAEGYSTRDAVVRGVRSSASTITSAALIMVSVFLAFATSHLAEMQQMGAGLAVAILIDATIIRGLLLPAIMVLLGRRNWYLPSWLQWLPNISAEGRLPQTAIAPGAGVAAPGSLETQPRELTPTR